MMKLVREGELTDLVRLAITFEQPNDEQTWHYCASPYSQFHWTKKLGPTAMLTVQILTRMWKDAEGRVELDAPFSIDIGAWADVLGVSRSNFTRGLERLCVVGCATYDTDLGLIIHTRWPEPEPQAKSVVARATKSTRRIKVDNPAAERVL